MARVLDNLVNNALRYCCSTVEISLIHQGNFATLIVEDDGPGIAPDAREHIFDPFVRLDPSRDRSTGDVVWDWRLYAPLPVQWAERSSVKKANQVVRNFDLAGKCYLYQSEIIRIAGQITYSMLNTARK